MTLPGAGVPVDEARVAAARLWAAERVPRLAAGVLVGPVIAVDGIGTVAVDERWRFYVDPFLVVAWAPEELGSVLVHHVGHLVLEHARRARSLSLPPEAAAAWLVAADAEVYDGLADAGLKPPLDPLLPTALGGDGGRRAEDYLALASAAAPRRAGRHDCGSGADGFRRGWDLPADGPPGPQAGLGRHARRLLRRQLAVRPASGSPAGVQPP